MAVRNTALITCVTLLLVIGAGIFLLTMPDARSTLLGSLTPSTEPVHIDPNADIEPQQKLEHPPHPIKAMYLTSWSAGGAAAVARAVDLISSTELNAVVIDIKDYTGMVSYKPAIAQVVDYEAFEPRIKKINALIKQFHDAGAYVIGRIAVFQDPQLAKARPEFALKSKKTGLPWGDRNGIHWMDAAAPAVWDYNIAIAKDALQRGFDEVQFDYIRFPTDGDLTDIQYAFYDPAKEPKRQVITNFLAHARSELPYANISVDIFGETAVFGEDTGIGQKFEDPFPYVDAVAPMIYPSHFASGFLGFTKPAEHPYDVILYAMNGGFAKLKKLEQTFLKTPSSTLPALAEIRPWLQDFNLGATYDAAKVRAQIDAANDAARKAAGCKTQHTTDNLQPTTDVCKNIEIGWMLWGAGSGNNTKGALKAEAN